jgi:hypothetical protein
MQSYRLVARFDIGGRRKWHSNYNINTRTEAIRQQCLTEIQRMDQRCSARDASDLSLVGI